LPMESFSVQVQTNRQYHQRSNDPIYDCLTTLATQTFCDVPIDHSIGHVHLPI
ncbi:hypothetical protein RDWZM_004484, partial [Blomia tropicalis]